MKFAFVSRYYRNRDLIRILLLNTLPGVNDLVYLAEKTHAANELVRKACEVMIDELVLEYLSLSDKMRNGYMDSLGTANPTWKEAFAKITSVIPEFFYGLYGKFLGTYRAVPNQKYMDFIPGYRLIHIEELESEYHSFTNMLELDDVCEAQIEVIIPILADYSSRYICYSQLRNNEEVIFYYSPDDGLQKMHHSIEQFLKTIIAFYKNGVYSLDKDGFLDYNFEKECMIGAKYNPDIAYWME